MLGCATRRRHAVSLAAGLFLAASCVLGLAEAAPRQYWAERPGQPPLTPPIVADWVTIAEAVKPAVVNVAAEMRGAPGRGLPQMGRVPQGGRASGVIITPDGYALTNNHVVDGATTVRVRLADGREFDAKIAGRDPQTDLALLKIDASGLPVIPLGNSSTLRVGEPVMAVGNPFGLEQTVTTGIVSATGRVIGEGAYDDFIQTDASINFGNSGGPLINARGEVIGINSFIVSRTGGSIGIGFAVPVNLAKFVVPQLAESGQVVRGWLGVTAQPLTPDLAAGLRLPKSEGALVSQVWDGSPAALAGLKRGDVIVEVDGRKVGRTTDLSLLVAATPVGKDVTVSVLREGKPLKLTATVARREQPAQLPSAPQSEPAQRARLGVAVEPVTPEMAGQLGVTATGVIVRRVTEGSAAAEAGLRPGDVITEANRQPVKSPEDLRRVVDAAQPGTPLLLLVQRDGTASFLIVKI
ncbi:MAG: trypsin-like peptidase domain-containing protein [Candidatus Rokuibacteriota bacterium]